MPKNITRRTFLGTSGVLAWAGAQGARAAAPGPNDRVTVGMIAAGSRGQEVIEAVKTVQGTEIVAVCDAYTGRLERAVARSGGRARIFKDHRELLADKSIDTVVIASPDHLHKRHVIESLEAGKDVYCEKPLTYGVEEGLEIQAAVKKSGRLLQVGSQGMSSQTQRKAKEFIQSGRLGQVTVIRAAYNRNSASGAWIYPIPPDASPETVDWNLFLGSAPHRPFDLERFFRWRCYEDYSGGIATDLFVHLCTTIHFLMDAKMPSKVADGRTLPLEGKPRRTRHAARDSRISRGFRRYSGIVVQQPVQLRELVSGSRHRGHAADRIQQASFRPRNQP